MTTSTTTYNVTTDKGLFRRILYDVFQGRELLTMMSVIVAYNEAIKAASDDGALYATIDYVKLCEEAADDGIDPSDIKTLLEKLSVETTVA